MTPKKFITYAEIDENGIPKAYSKQDVLDFCKLHPGRRLEIEYNIVITDEDTLRQIRYYWSVIVQNIKFGLMNIGTRMDPLQVHEYLRQNSSIGVEVTIINGSPYKQIKSTEKGSFDKGDWYLYIEECIQFAAEELSVVIPEPNHNRIDLTRKIK